MHLTLLQPTKPGRCQMKISWIMFSVRTMLAMCPLQGLYLNSLGCCNFLVDLYLRVLYRPWDYSDYTQRVRSYSLANWFAKPSVISSFKCAAYGWNNTSQDCITCGACQASLRHASGNYLRYSLVLYCITVAYLHA